jgi:hypothetical protein
MTACAPSFRCTKTEGAACVREFGKPKEKSMWEIVIIAVEAGLANLKTLAEG